MYIRTFGVMCLVLMGTLTHAQELFLRNDQTGEFYGPFRPRLGAKIAIGDQTFTVTRKGRANSRSSSGRTALRMDLQTTVGEFKWCVLQLQELGSTARSNNMYIENRQGTNTRFVRLRGTVENLEKKEVSGYDSVWLIDNEGREYSPMDRDSFFVSKGARILYSAKLRPNIPFIFEAVFEVPLKSTIKQVKVGDIKQGFGVTKSALIQLGK